MKLTKYQASELAEIIGSMHQDVVDVYILNGHLYEYPKLRIELASTTPNGSAKSIIHEFEDRS